MTDPSASPIITSHRQHTQHTATLSGTQRTAPEQTAAVSKPGIRMDYELWIDRISEIESSLPDPGISRFPGFPAIFSFYTGILLNFTGKIMIVRYSAAGHISGDR